MDLHLTSSLLTPPRLTPPHPTLPPPLPTSPSPQAMISGVKAQNQTVEDIERLEEQGMEQLRNREFAPALETLDSALVHASGCLRLKMARGDCLAHLGRSARWCCCCCC